MAVKFNVPESVTVKVLESLKRSHLVHPDAQFNYTAENGLRKEVAYRDLDFFDRTGKPEFSNITVDSALRLLKDMNIADEKAVYDKQRLQRFRNYHAEKMTNKSWTSFSPVMESMFYMLTSVKRPDRMIELGCFWGNTLAWFCSPCIGPDPGFQPSEIIGVDIDADAIRMAQDNFSRIENSEPVTIMCEDALDTIKNLKGFFDIVYIETKAPGKNDLYLPMIKAIYDNVPKNGWVIAHDATRYTMQDDLKDYLAFVRDRSNFRESISFDIDAYGLELTVK